MNCRIVHILLIGVMVSSILIGAGCSSAEESHETHTLHMADESILPDEIRDAPDKVREAYRFAVANPDVLSYIPCYCGCVQGGHRDNLDCYVAAFRSDGTVAEFDNHAVYCEICIDITQDTMELQSQGYSLREIRFYVDTTYPKYGPTTETPPVQ